MAFSQVHFAEWKGDGSGLDKPGFRQTWVLTNEDKIVYRNRSLCAFRIDCPP
jgi:hypothetical protein